MQELSLAVPEDDAGGDEHGGGDLVNDTVESLAGSSNPGPSLCASPSRRLKHLHSSVLVTFDDPDLEAEEQEVTALELVSSPSQAALIGASPQNSNCPDNIKHGAAASLPACSLKGTRSKCMAGLDSAKPRACTGKGSTAQECKAETRKQRGVLFIDGPEIAAGNDSLKAQEEAVHLPKLGTSKRRSASMGGGLVGSRAASKSVTTSGSGASGAVSKVADNRLPSARRPRTLSASSPGGISSEVPQKAQPQKRPT